MVAVPARVRWCWRFAYRREIACTRVGGLEPIGNGRTDRLTRVIPILKISETFGCGTPEKTVRIAHNRECFIFKEQLKNSAFAAKRIAFS